MRRAFSLVEVVLAIGVFAGAVAVILSLLPALTRQSAVAADTLAAQRLPDALRIELQRLANTGGFDTLASRIPTMRDVESSGLAFVASRDAARLHARDYLAPAGNEALPVGEQYFLVEVWRFPAPPLAYPVEGAVLPVHVRVEWPYRATDGTETPGNRATLAFSLALNR